MGNLTGALTTELQREHVLILGILDSLRALKRGSVSTARRAIGLLKEVLDEIHHPKEENYLFRDLHAIAELNNGGPRCGLYMGRLIDHDPARIFIDQAKREFQFEVSPSEIAARLVSENSLLTIPLSEHDGGKAAMHILERKLNASEADPSQWEDFQFHWSKFEGMLRLHIEKEDTCLFQMADALLSPERQSELIAEINSAHPEWARRIREIAAAPAFRSL